MPHRFKQLVACVTSALLLTTVLGVSPASAQDPVDSTAELAAGPGFGAQFHGMWSSYDDTQRALVLDNLRAAGATSVRIDVAWSMLQPRSRDHYSSWGTAFVDRVVTMANDRGLKPLVMLWMTPDWANGGAGPRVLPTDPQDYADVARWAAERWRGKVAAWEVWNEPNLDDFMVGSDPAAYARLLRAAYPAFHAGDPDTTVVMAGVAYNDDKWLARAYAAGVKGYFDVLATHPYQAVADLEPEAPDDGTIWRLRHAPAVHDLMAANGDGHKKIWFTEFGWSSHENPPDVSNWQRGVTEAQQADYLVRALQLIAAEMPYVERVFWYAERDRTDSHIQNNNYGLMRVDLSPKPVLTAVQTYLTQRAAPTTGQLTTQPVADPTPAPTVLTGTKKTLRLPGPWKSSRTAKRS